MAPISQMYTNYKYRNNSKTDDDEEAIYLLRSIHFLLNINVTYYSTNKHKN